MKIRFFFVLSLFSLQILLSQEPVEFVNPFIGTSNYGATNPGAIAPRGMASVSPFNVAGGTNKLEKDSQWLSNPYVHENVFLTGFSHVNLSGVGCPDLGVILAMPTTGDVETNHETYGTTYKNETAKAGYYAVELDKYQIKAEVTASTRVGVSRYTFPKGKANILINLGLGLTNEQGGMLKINSPSEVEGMRTVGSFCYNNPEASYPVYFVAQLSKPSKEFGAWKNPYNYEGVEAQWMTYNDKVRIKKGFTREVVGDSIGAYFSYDFQQPTEVELKVAVSYVSIENARENLQKEVGNRSFNEIYKETRDAWNEKLSVAEVEGGSAEDKTVFYTALYHTQIHPNIFSDVNGEYPEIATGKIGQTEGSRYTVFSLWDTYRNYHQLMTLLYPGEQTGMINSMLAMYDENGWLPKWELNSTETFTMVGDPASVVIADSYLRGLRNFDVEKAYQAMLKGATVTENNPLRPGNAEYVEKGYLSVESGIAGPVSTTQEYNISDFAIAQLAKALGKKEDYKNFYKRSLSYRKLYDSETGLLRPKKANGDWYEPFDPNAGANFTKNVGYIEGNAWQYVYMVPHDIRGIIKLKGGGENFIQQLDYIFDAGHYDMANEPDFGYPFLYNFVTGENDKAQKRINDLLDRYYSNAPAGLPGNDDTGTMSAWVIYAMIGFYPVTPADPVYTLFAPKFNKITLHLEDNHEVIIKSFIKAGEPLKYILIDGKKHENLFISHSKLIGTSSIEMY